MIPRVLVVDDEPDFSELAAFNLRRAGYEVQQAANGLDALQITRETLPDLVLLDVMLPEVDGFAVCEYIRKNPRTARIPVLLVTACCTDLSRSIGLEAGATGYLTKPVSPRELVQQVEHVLRESGLERGEAWTRPNGHEPADTPS